MEITAEMDLGQLKEHMSRSEITTAEARAMRRLLLSAGYAGTDTADVPDVEWQEMLIRTMEVERIQVADITETDTRPAGWWTSEDGQGQLDMTGDTLEQAKRTLLDTCADDEQRDRILAGHIQILPRQTVTLINPWSGATVEHDLSGLTEAQLDAYARLMDDASREATHAAVAPCTPAEFLAAWVERVGPKEAGRVILGS